MLYAAPVTPSVTVAPSTLALEYGEGATTTTGQLTATTVPADAEVTWSSDTEGVATVSDAGLVTAAGTGTATITATITVDGETYTASCGVTVAAPSTEG